MRWCRPSVLRNAIAASTILACGCTSSPTMPSRAVLTDAVGTPFESPLVLIGVEKESRTLVGRAEYQDCVVGTVGCFNTLVPATERPAKGSSLRWDIRKRFREPKSLFVSHIVEIKPQAGVTVPRVDTIFTAYDGNSFKEPGADHVSRSWDVLQHTLRDELVERIRASSATHLIVMSTGWNTPQSESLANYADWVREFNAKFKTTSVEIRPVYVGWSWPSDWNNKVVTKLDYQNKAHDADELGLMWANVLVNRVLPSIKAEVPVRAVLVGHSFGARIQTRAVYSAPMIVPECPSAAEAADLLIGLQGAFSALRFIDGKGSEGYPYRDYRTCGPRVVLTFSKSDEAVDVAPSSIFDGVFVGDERGFESTVGLPAFGHRRVAQGGIADLDGTEDATVIMLDASTIITVPKGHNDVYNSDVAVLVTRLIERFAPPLQKDPN